MLAHSLIHSIRTIFLLVFVTFVDVVLRDQGGPKNCENWQFYEDNRWIDLQTLNPDSSCRLGGMSWMTFVDDVFHPLLIVATVIALV